MLRFGSRASKQTQSITNANRARADDGSIRADMSLVVAHRGFEDFRILWQIALGECGHHAARAGPGYLNPHLRPDGDHLTDPVVFDKARLPPGINDHIGTE